MPAKVFISSGQAGTPEREAAIKVKDWLEDPKRGFKAYVAVDENTIVDLNREIVEELKSSDYFLLINFAREEIRPGLKRGSVWVSQELAMAASLGFESDRILLLNQQGAERGGMFNSIVSNAEEFVRFDEIVPIIEKCLKWDKSSSRHLKIEHPRIEDTPVKYGNEGHLLYMAHVDVINSRHDTVAADCEIRLVQIDSPAIGERESPDENRLKVTTTRDSYVRSIHPKSHGTFDLFGIESESYPNIRLLSEADIQLFPIISTTGRHFLTYKISGIGFPTITAKIGLDLPGSPPPSNPGNTIYQSSGASVTYSIKTYPEIVGPPPTPWLSLPSVWVEEQGPA